ncbi:unnamed protein product [Ixodes persulcatus]
MLQTRTTLFLVTIAACVVGSTGESRWRNTEFSLNLLRELPRNKSTNTVFSPIGAFIPLAILNNGANGETGQEIQRVLSSTKTHSREDLLSLFQAFYETVYHHDANNSYFEQANVFIVKKETKKKLRPAFRKLLDKGNGLHASMWGMSDQLPFQIDQWVGAETNKKITHILDADALDQNTVMLAVNVIRFKGLWSSKFEQRLNSIDTFHNADGTAAPTTFMFKRFKTGYHFDEDLKTHVVALPYQKLRARFIIFLPLEPARLDDLKSKLSATRWRSTLQRLDKRNVALSLPKFKLSSRYDLVGPLKKLGINILFGHGADLSGIDGDRDLFVSGFLQVSKLQVDEAGSEAESVTVVKVSGKSAETAATVTVDHPFLFFITVGADDVLLFAGQVNHIEKA